MQKRQNEPIDYLCIGHLTWDQDKSGALIGGTAAFSSLTAQALGLRAAILTAGLAQSEQEDFNGIEILGKPSSQTTSFHNIETAQGRIQYISDKALDISKVDVPEFLIGQIKILHLGPVADEVDPGITDLFPDVFIGITPQGWMRRWNEDGLVSYKPWNPSEELLRRANAVVFSIEDVSSDEKTIHSLAQLMRILAVTEGKNGARVYWNGDVHSIHAPEVPVLDTTGAGDIFAAVFFARLMQGCDPWEAGRQAVRLASLSVSRRRLKSVPTKQEIQTTMVEIF
jgi:sugar/nucleoside kinase (ribokinase family)